LVSAEVAGAREPTADSARTQCRPDRHWGRRARGHPGVTRPAGTIGHVSNPLTPWKAIRDRLLALPEASRAVFALACAERLVAHTTSERTPGLRAALTLGWSAVLAGQGDLAELCREFDTRPDLNDDEVAAVAYALRAAGGSPDDAWWAASREMDAAFERIAHSEVVNGFRALDVDAAEPVVQAEMQWQQAVLDQLEQTGPTEELVSRLRS